MPHSVFKIWQENDAHVLRDDRVCTKQTCRPASTNGLIYASKGFSKIPMKWTFFGLCAGSLISLVLFLKERDISAGVERLAEMRLAHAPALDADPNLKLVSERSAYMRTER
jgi:hypothetical protein